MCEEHRKLPKAKQLARSRSRRKDAAKADQSPVATGDPALPEPVRA